MDDDIVRVPRAPRRGRASLSGVNPPLRTVGPGGRRGGINSRSSMSIATPPPSAALATPRQRNRRVSIESPWLGERMESPTTAMSSMPATRGETTHFRRAEEQWRSAARAREGYRRLSLGVTPPTLEQRLAWRREEDQDNPRGRGEILSNQRQRWDGDSGGHRPDGVPVNEPSATSKSSDVNNRHVGVALNGSGGSGTGAFDQSERANGEDGQSTGVGESAGSGGGDNEPTEESLDRAAVRARIWAIYQAHNPEKLDTVDQILEKYVGRWDTVLKRLEEKYVSESNLPFASGNGPLCFMDIEIGGEPIGRLVFRLFADKAPKAAENFRALCAGEKGPGFRYESSAFHRIIPGFVAQGGDFTTGDGRGGRSIYGGKFEDEPFMRHHKLGLLSMANSGPNTNGSQFFITLQPTAHLDGKHVVFGELQTGIRVLNRMKSVELLEPKREGKPASHQRVVIARCGQLQDNASEMPRAAAPSPLPAAGSRLFPLPDQGTSQTFGPVFGHTSTLGGQPTQPLTASVAHASKSPLFSGLGRPTGDVSGFTPSSSASELGGGGLFSSELAAPVSSFGSLHSTKASEEKPATVGSERSSGGKLKVDDFARPPNPITIAAAAGLSTVASSFASLAAAVSAGPPSSHLLSARVAPDVTSFASNERKDATPGARGGGGDRVRVAVTPGPREQRPKFTPEAAFDRLDRTRTGWVGHDEIKALVSSAGLSYSPKEHGLSLLKLCSLRLSKERFLEWYKSAINERQQQAPHSSNEGSSRADSREAGAGTKPTVATPTASAETVELEGERSVTAATATSGQSALPRWQTAPGDCPNGEGDESDGEEERRKERSKAGAAFDKVDDAGRGWIEKVQFEELMEAVGTTYSVEYHEPKLVAISSGNRLERDMFLTWYDNWLFDQDDSSAEDQEVGGLSAALKISKAEGGFSSVVASQATCERAKPRVESKVATSAPVTGISTTGPMFGATFGSIEATGDSTLGSPSTTGTITTATSISSNTAGGLAFGGPPAGAPDTVATGGSPSMWECRFGSPVEKSPTSTTPLASSDPPGLTGGAEGAADQSDGDGKDDDVDDEERREERAKAEAAFDEVDADSKGWVEEARFEALMETVGTTYSVEDHKPKLLSICRENRLEREVFLEWYDDWLFGEDDSSEEGGEDIGVVSAGKASKTEGFSSLVASQAGGWRCEACLVSNPESAIVCQACETVKPGEEGKMGTIAPGRGASSTGLAFGATIGISKATGNFTFGSSSATGISTIPTTISSGSNASGGFTFGNPPAGTPVTIKTKTGHTVRQSNFRASPTVASNPSTPAGRAHEDSKAGTQSGGDDEENSNEGSGGDNDDDDVDDEERREERAKAEAAFDEVDADSKGWVEEAQFEALMEAVGTTYSVEDHKPKLLSICRENRLEREVFLEWYDDWLFGEDDSSDEEGEGIEMGGAANAPKSEGFSSLLASQAGGWKCGACLVSNPESAIVCPACEAVKPGEEGKVGAIAAGSNLSSARLAFGATIGTNKVTGGFTFGSSPAPATVTPSVSASPGSMTGGITFGSPSTPANVKTSVPSESGSHASGGFTFGNPPTGAPITVTASASHTAKGFIFGASPNAVSEPHTPAGRAHEDSKAGTQSGGDGEENSNEGSGSDNDDNDDVDDEERREERAKAEAAFDEVDADSKGWMEEAQFEALMETVGTTYSEEDHKPKLLSICRENRLEREVFLEWYDDWLFGEDDSSDEEGEGIEMGGAANAPKSEGFSSLLASQAGGWKCGACLVSNPESAIVCPACEAVKPGEEGKVGASGASSAGLAFGAKIGASKATDGFTFGSSSAPATVTTSVPASSGSMTGGLTFGSPSTPANVKTLVPAKSGSNASGGFTFGNPPAGAPITVTASASHTAKGFIFGASPNAVSEPHTPSGRAHEDSKAGTQSGGDGEENSNEGSGSDNDDDDVDDEERREERAKAEAAFDEVDADSQGWVGEAQFEALMETVGTTYSVEDHKPKLLSVCRENRLEREVFLEWYDDWLFGEDDSSDEEGEGIEADGATNAPKSEGFSSLLASQAGGWKCGACLVSNPESAIVCPACEAVKPGEEDKVGASGASSTGLAFGATIGASKATGGFTFGARPAGKPVANVAASGPTVGGFSFGVPVVATPALAAPSSSPLDPAGGESDGNDETEGKGNSDKDGDDDVDDEERREERSKAEAAFDEVDCAGRGWVEKAQFEALMEAVGTTYSVEDHEPELLSICRGNRLERKVFLELYDNWLFGEDDSSDEGGERGEEVNAAAKTGGFSSLIASQAGGWKCRASLVSNPESAIEYPACEAVKPGEERRVVESDAGGSASSSSSTKSSTGGFTFGSVPAPTSVLSSGVQTSGNFTFRSTAPRAAITALPPIGVPSGHSIEAESSPSRVPERIGTPLVAEFRTSADSGGGEGTPEKGTRGDISVPATSLSHQTGTPFVIGSPPATFGSRFTFALPTRAESDLEAVVPGRDVAEGGTATDSGGESSASMGPPPAISAFGASGSGETGNWAEGLISPRALDNLTPRSRARRLTAGGRGRGRRGLTPAGTRKK